MDTTSKKNLGKNFFFNFASQILTLIIPLITSPYLARVLHETGNGQYSYAISIITYFTLFANLGFDVYGQRQIALKFGDKEEQSKTFFEIFILKIVFTFISLIVLYAIGFSVGYGENYTKLILILSINVISVPFDIQFLFRGLEKFKLIAIRTIIIKIINLVCIFLFVKTENDLWVYALITACSTLLSNLVMWTSIRKDIKFVKFYELKFKRHIGPAVMIFLPTLTTTVYSVFDKTMIGLLSQNPDYDNGCYEKAYSLNSIMLLCITFISQVMASRNAQEYGKDNYDNFKTNLYFSINYIWLISLPLIIGNYVLADNLSSWFLGDGYIEVPDLLRIMSVRFIVSGLGNMLGSEYFVIIGKERYCFWATLAAAILNVGMNALLIPQIGALGAAFATAACEVITFLILCIFVFKENFISLKIILFLSWKYVVSAVIMFIPIYFLNKCFSYSILSFLLCTLVGVVTYFIALLILKDKFVLNGLNIIKNIILKKRENIDEN